MKISLFFAFVLFAATVFAQNDLPADIKNSFDQKYPKARDINWSESNGRYDIEFYLSTDMFTASYDESGNWIETAIIIADDQIPQNLLLEIAKKYPDARLAYGEKVTSATNQVYLRVVAESELNIYTIKAKVDGSVIINVDIQNYNSIEEEEPDSELEDQ